MSEIDDGVIKYDRSFFTYEKYLEHDEYSDLEKWRETLFNLKLIGEYERERVGYGNLSWRRCYNTHELSPKNPKAQFVITGTQTGKFPHLDGTQYTRVLNFELETLKVIVNGPVEASSEALTHAAIYQSNPEINVIFHVHHLALWDSMIKENYETTPAHIPYGTFEMAKSTMEKVKNHSSGSFAMKGHKEGIITYGKNLLEAGTILLEIYDKFQR